jgi:hypothetical protein
MSKEHDIIPDNRSVASASKENAVAYVEDVPVENDVWGTLDGEGPNYRGLGWVRASVILVKIQIGLGVLAIVSRFPPSLPR